MDDVKRRAIFQTYRVNADILILQETHSSQEFEKIWENEWGGVAFFSHGSTNARGVAVFVAKSHKNRIKNIQPIEGGRLIIFDYVEQGQIVTIAAIYAPNIDTPQYFKQIAEVLREKSVNKVLIGDFNLVLDVEKDRLNTYNNNNKSKEVIEDMMDEFCLREVWRNQHKDAREYSWFKSGNIQKASRIDFALVSGGLDQKVQHSTYIPGVKTDHRALYMVIDLLPYERGSGYWKLNTSHLQNREFIEQMNKEISKTLQVCDHKSPKEKWEYLKVRIKKTAVKFSRQQASESNLVISQLMEKVDEYETRLPLTKEEDEILQTTKADLDEKTMEKAAGAIFRSKVKWYEQGEKGTKYFFALEKTKYNAKTCYEIITEDNKKLESPEEILQEQRKFYQELYQEDQGVDFTLQNNTQIIVPEQIRTDQNQQLSVVNLQEAIRKMENNKTPGEDGIPVDFYKVFWNQIKQAFFDMALQSYEENQLHASARKGILNLIPKANKDTRYVKNLRPITLLNTDYKIIEKAIAEKMIPALKHIIAKDQRGFMKERRISVNIRKILDIIESAEKQDLEAVVLSLDFVKCFDKCSFSILHGSLRFFQFGDIIQQWTKILYKDFTVKIQNNGFFSEDIDIHKGVHQGGCCSSIYFLVIAEILAIALRANQEIEGITIQDIKNLLNQFADDMDICSLCKESSIKAIFQELENFRKQSGFTVSYDKTTLYRIGSLRHSNAQMYDIDTVKWSNEDITVLGVKIAHEDIIPKNYETLVAKARQTLNAWFNRGLSLIGKVQVVNALVASLFVHKMMVLPIIPKNIVQQVDNVIRSFLWDNKKAKIAYSILQNPKKQGGLNLVNLKNKDISLTQIQSKCNATSGILKDTPRRNISDINLGGKSGIVGLKGGFAVWLLQNWNYRSECEVNRKIKVGELIEKINMFKTE